MHRATLTIGVGVTLPPVDPHPPTQQSGQFVAGEDLPFAARGEEGVRL